MNTTKTSINDPRKRGCALITGASGGIGAEFARTFARNGHSLILVARRADKLEALARELRREHGVAVDVIPQDLGQSGAAVKLQREVTRRGLAVDILVNNAGLLGLNGYARVEYDHVSKTQVNETTPPELSTWSQDVVNASLGLVSDARQLDVMLWARNLTNDESLISTFPTIAQDGSYSGYPTVPRMYGVTVRKTF